MFISIGITLFLFFIVTALILIASIQEHQRAVFKKQADQIFASYKKKEFNASTDDMSTKQDYTIFIFKNGQLEYSNLNIHKDQHGQELTASVYKQKYFNHLNSDYLSYENKNGSYHIFVSTINDLSPRAIFQLTKKLILYGSILGLIVSFILSVIYSRNMRKQFNQVNTFIESFTDTPESKAPKQRTLNTEFKALETNISDVFTKLDQTSKKLEAQYAKEQKQQKDRIDFIRGSNHELKTPIMSLRLILEGMLYNYPEYEDKEYFLHVSIKKLDEMKNLVNEIMDASRLEVDFVEGSSNLTTTIQNTVDLFEPIILDQNVTISLQNSNPDTIINIPGKHLKKVCSNLVSNALKYSPHDSTIEIGYGANPLVFYIRNKMASSVQLDVKEIIRPFHTQDQSSEEFQSHGLGLFVVDNILSNYEYLYEIRQEKAHFSFIIYLTQER